MLLNCFRVRAQDTQFSSLRRSMCKIVSLLDKSCNLFPDWILQTFVESCVLQIAKICNISIQRYRSGNCLINVCFFVISFWITEFIDKNCSLISSTNVGPICNMLFSVYSNTGTDLCRGGSKRYFSCNIQVGDGLLNNSFYTHKQTCSVPFECHSNKIRCFLQTSAFTSRPLWELSLRLLNFFTVLAFKEAKLGKTVTLLLLYEMDSKYYGSLLANPLVHV